MILYGLWLTQENSYSENNMEEILILQEEETIRKEKKFYDAIVAASSYIESCKSEKIEIIKQNYGKKPQPQLLS